MKNFAVIAALVSGLLIGCSDETVQQPSMQYKCPDGLPPTKVVPGQSYITIVCQDGTVDTQTVADYNQRYGSSYTSGQDMLADTLMWYWLFGPHYYSYPYYHSYMRSPYYASYRPSTYVMHNRTIIQNFGGNPSRAYAARTLQVQSYTISRANGNSSRSYTTYTTSGKSYNTYSSGSSSSYRSGSFGGRRK